MASDQKDPVSILMRARTHGRALRDAYRGLDARTHHVIGVVLKIMLAGYFVFCAMFLTARYVIWPHIENYKMEIEQVDQATFPPRAFQRKFDGLPWRHDRRRFEAWRCSRARHAAFSVTAGRTLPTISSITSESRKWVP